jgi:hypothetical protein
MIAGNSAGNRSSRPTAVSGDDKTIAPKLPFIGVGTPQFQYAEDYREGSVGELGR